MRHSAGNIGQDINVDRSVGTVNSIEQRSFHALHWALHSALLCSALLGCDSADGAAFRERCVQGQGQKAGRNLDLFLKVYENAEKKSIYFPDIKVLLLCVSGIGTGISVSKAGVVITWYCMKSPK